ncbi:MAG: hypothetical protein K2X27_04720 [Candidatus Obscuribacterales bacterium]|nr:hypothetical protein [Candidatus Obscuribacterales bacterium]
MVRSQSVRTEEGTSLATVLIIGLVCTLWISGLFASVLPTTGKAKESRIKTAVRAASEAALDWAVSDLSNGNTNSIDATTYGQSKTSSVPTNFLGAGGFPITAQVTVLNTQPSYSTSPSYTNGSSESFLYDQTLDKDLSGNGGLNRWRVVTAVARCANRTSSVRCVLKPIAATTPPVTGWGWGAVATGVSFRQNGSGATVDYYNSSTNPNPSSFSTKADPNDADTSIGLQGKSGTGNSVTFNGGGTIGGTLSYTSGTTISGSPTTNGTNAAFTGNVFPPVPSSKNLPYLNNNNPISGSFTINPGSYQFTSNSTAITGGPITIPATATAANPVKIFIDSAAATAISLNGKNGVFNNLSGIPAALQIYIVGTSAVNIGGNGDFRGVLYAPNAAVTISGTGAIYGAVVGNTVTMNGSVSGMHYDQALANAPSISFPGGTSVTNYRSVVSWQELD